MSGFDGIIVEDMCDEILEEREEMLDDLVQWSSFFPAHRERRRDREVSEGGEEWTDLCLNSNLLMIFLKAVKELNILRISD
jgi:hypothetical protein